MHTYHPDQCNSFMKNSDKYGFLSNMNCKYSFYLDGLYIKSTEHLYQALKHTDRTIIDEILSTPSPLMAKKVSYEYPIDEKGWKDIKLMGMIISILLKYKLNNDFKKALDDLDNKSIVEISYKDQYWGCRPNSGVYVGNNYLGRSLKYVKDNNCSIHDPKFYKVLHNTFLCQLNLKSII